jgi:hypothetical protein
MCCIVWIFLAKYRLMKNNIILTLLLVVFLASCNSVTNVPVRTTTPVPTPIETTMPTPTITSTPTQSGWHWSNALVTFNDMTVLSGNEVWAIGQNGTIIHDKVHVAHLSEVFDYQGQRGGGYLSAIDFASENDGWITGWAGQIFHWDGKSWTVNMPPDLEKGLVWLDINFAKKDVGWVVGCYRNGSNDIAVLNKWNGNSWENVSLTGEVNNGYCLNEIEVVTDTDVWVIGDKYQNGILLHWDGLSWKQFLAPPLGGGVAVGAVATGQVWVLGGDGIYYWDNNTWTHTEMPVYFWYSENGSAHPKILAVSQNNVWVGGRTLYHWDGNEWQNKNYDEKYGYIVDIETDPDGKVWALTLSGTILELNE